MKITKILFLVILLIISLPEQLSPVQGFIPNDPVGDPWHLNTIKIHSVWDHGYNFQSTSGAVGLCVIGFAITDDQNGDLNVTERASFAWNNDFTSYLAYPNVATSSHEAAVASVAASTINNGIGVAGIVNAPLYSAWPWGNFPNDEIDYYHVYMQMLINIFDWCTGFGKMVFTMSFIDYLHDLEITDPVLIELQNKVSSLYESGQALFFAASANSLFQFEYKDIPQSLPYVRVVGRINREGLYESGGYGENEFLVAPAGGVPVYDQTSGGYGTFGGASCSAPIVAASAVLLWNQFPWSSNAQIEDALVWGATDILDPGWDEKSGFGILNVEKARAYLVDNIPSSNSYSLNWTATTGESFHTTSSLTNNSGESIYTTTSSINAGDIFFATTSLIILTVSIKRRKTSKPGKN
ncbi:MAG: S8 family serine peptidase, partial [Candidatus Hodarchaeota archaeon]